MPSIAFLECSHCGRHLPADVPQTFCPADCGALYVRYNMDELSRSARRENPALYAGASTAALGMWRYRDVLPAVTPVSLGEGWTPMVQSRRYPGLLLKEEGANPTGTFEARGLSLAVSMAKYFGLRHLALPFAGDAAGALAAYAAAAGIDAHLFMPEDVPVSTYLEAVLYGADLTLVSGLVSDCARLVADRIRTQRETDTPDEETWFDISTLKEPYCLEGKKTMGYELVEQLGWQYPEAIFYPTGCGVGLLGMWKAFDEMEQLGWIDAGSKRPRMYAVQSTGVAPGARAFRSGAYASDSFTTAETFARGPRVPEPCGGSLVMDIVHRSGGRAIAATDHRVLGSLLDFARQDGLFLSPEGAAATAAYTDVLATGELRPSDRVVLFNTGAGLKHADAVAKAIHLRPTKLPTSLPVGGIITPV